MTRCHDASAPKGKTMSHPVTIKILYKGHTEYEVELAGGRKTIGTTKELLEFLKTVQGAGHQLDIDPTRLTLPVAGNDESLVMLSTGYYEVQSGSGETKSLRRPSRKKAHASSIGAVLTTAALVAGIVVGLTRLDAASLMGVEGRAPAVAEEVAAAQPEFDYYTVAPGDSLARIAYRQLGSVEAADAIFEANRDIVADPTLIEVGMRLRIPKSH